MWYRVLFRIVKETDQGTADDGLGFCLTAAALRPWGLALNGYGAGPYIMVQIANSHMADGSGCMGLKLVELLAWSLRFIISTVQGLSEP